jgi:hypothetical protein
MRTVLAAAHGPRTRAAGKNFRQETYRLCSVSSHHEARVHIAVAQQVLMSVQRKSAEEDIGSRLCIFFSQN